LQEKQFRKLNEKKNDIDVKVLRNQKQTEVSVYQVFFYKKFIVFSLILFYIFLVIIIKVMNFKKY
jgi:hypothetical protein